MIIKGETLDLGALQLEMQIDTMRSLAALKLSDNDELYRECSRMIDSLEAILNN